MGLLLRVGMVIQAQKWTCYIPEFKKHSLKISYKYFRIITIY